MAARRFSVTDLARQSGVSRDTIYGILGKERSAEDDTLAKLSEAIGRPVPDLTVQSEAPSSPVEPRKEAGRGNPPSDLERLETLRRRLGFLRSQIEGYRALGQSPGPAVLAEWFELLADLNED